MSQAAISAAAGDAAAVAAYSMQALQVLIRLQVKQQTAALVVAMAAGLAEGPGSSSSL